MSKSEVSGIIFAPKGRYRLLEIDICYADGFLGDPEECTTRIGDYGFYFFAWVKGWLMSQLGHNYSFVKFLRLLMMMPDNLPSGRFHFQIHNDSGDCVKSFMPNENILTSIYRQGLRMK